MSTLNNKPVIFIMGSVIAMVLCLSGCTSSPVPTAVKKEKWHWDNPDKQSESAGYAQVIKYGDTLYVSGIPTNDLSEEGVKRLYAAIKKSLNAYGATAKHIVKETLFTTDIERMAELNAVRKAFYQGDYPAASWVQVSRLYMADAKLEVEVIARIPTS